MPNKMTIAELNGMGKLGGARGKWVGRTSGFTTMPSQEFYRVRIGYKKGMKKKAKRILANAMQDAGYYLEIGHTVELDTPHFFVDTRSFQTAQIIDYNIKHSEGVTQIKTGESN